MHATVRDVGGRFLLVPLPDAKAKTTTSVTLFRHYPHAHAPTTEDIRPVTYQIRLPRSSCVEDLLRTLGPIVGISDATETIYATASKGGMLMSVKKSNSSAKVESDQELFLYHQPHRALQPAQYFPVELTNWVKPSSMGFSKSHKVVGWPGLIMLPNETKEQPISVASLRQLVRNSVGSLLQGGWQAKMIPSCIKFWPWIKWLKIGNWRLTTRRLSRNYLRNCPWVYFGASRPSRNASSPLSRFNHRRMQRG